MKKSDLVNIVIGIIVVIGFIFFMKHYSVKRLSIDQSPTLGSEDAPITMYIFADFSCPQNRKYMNDTFPRIKSEYIDTGKVQYVFKNYLLHGDSQESSEAAYCAGEQGKFWEFAVYLFKEQGKWRLADDLQEKFTEYAETFDLDTDAFSECLSAKKYESMMEEEDLFAQKMKVQATPMFFVNGVRAVGAHNYSTFKKMFEEQLG